MPQKKDFRPTILKRPEPSKEHPNNLLCFSLPTAEALIINEFLKAACDKAYQEQSDRIEAKLKGKFLVEDLAPRDRKRIKQATTLKEASIQCCLPEYIEVNKDDLPEELQWYDSQEYEDKPKPAQISLIGAYAFNALARRSNT